MRKWLLTLLVINAVAFVYYRYDEALDPRLAAWRSEVDEQSSGESDAFYLLWGLSVGATERFIEHGKREFEEYNGRLAFHFFSSVPESPPYDYKHYADPLDEYPLFCKLASGSVDCIDRLLANKATWESTVSQFESFRRGYEQFVTLTDYRNLSHPKKYQWEPFYPVLELGQRLKALDALTLWLEGKADKALALLASDIRLLSQHLPEVQSKYYLNTLLRMVEADQVLINYIATQSASSFPAVAPIRLEDIPVERIMRREIVSYSYFLDTSAVLKLIAPEPGGGIAQQAAFGLRKSLGYRRKMTVNQFFVAAAPFADPAYLRQGSPDGAKSLTLERSIVSAVFNSLGSELLSELLNGRFGWKPVNDLAAVERINGFIRELY